MSALEAAAGRARSLAPVDRPSLAGTRWRRPKAVLGRILRLATAPQARFNHATADALDEARRELAACRTELAEVRAELARLEHATRRVHGPLLVDLIDRVGGLLPAPE